MTAVTRLAQNQEATSKAPPLHPAEIRWEEFLLSLGLSAGKVASSSGVPRTRIAQFASAAP